MDDKEDNERNGHGKDKEADEELEAVSLMSEETTFTTNVCGPQVTELIIRKPEFSFLNKYYNLLYQTLIPNCKLTVNILKEHLEVSDDTEDYILEGGNRRIKCQKVLNLLIAHLDEGRDFMQFCYLFNKISIMTDLPHKFNTELEDPGNWNRTTQHLHPQLLSFKQHDKYITQSSINVYTDNAQQAINLSASSATIDQLENSTIHCNICDGASGDRAEKCYISSHRQANGRKRFVGLPITTANMQFNCSPQTSSVIPVMQSSSLEYAQQNILNVFQPSSCVSTVSDTLTTFSSTPITTLGVVESLTTSSSVVTSISGEVISPVTTTTDLASSTSMAEEHILPNILTTISDFSELKAHYHTILDLMPDDYELTAGILQNYISDDQICGILCSSNSTIANKIILDCLIERMNCREELLDLYDQLESITASHDLKDVINKLRSGVQQSIQPPVSALVDATRSLLSSDQQHDLMSPSVNSPMFQMMLSQILLDPNSKVFAVIKKNYTRLCQCLPQDYRGTTSKLKRLLNLPDNFMSDLSNFPTVGLINEALIGSLISAIKSDGGALEFCDIMESLVDNASSKMDIEVLRNEMLEALSTAVTTATISTFTTLQTTVATDSNVQQFSGSCDNGNAHHTASIPSVNTAMTSSVNTAMTSSVNTATTSSVNTTTTSSMESQQLEQGVTLSSLQDRLKYDDRRLQKGFKYIPPPPLPSNHVNRQILLDEIVTKLLQATTDTSQYETTLTITGAGGFGKTNIVTSLCHHPLVKKQFKDGFLFIELGPQATDSSIKLTRLYHLLTGEKLKQGDINHVELEILGLVSSYYRNLLVIIDDVWHIEDAEPIVKAFSQCKTILTTRMNNIDQYLPSKQVVNIGPMTEDEAISLLTSGIIDSSRLSQEDVSLLNELAEDVHLWPLLLSLIRGQLSHYLKHYHLSCRKAIENVQTKLHHKGLTAFDKNSMHMDSTYKSRKLAVKACIEITVELVSTSLTNKLKTLILWTGVGTSFRLAVLHKLWNISKQELEEVVDVLWAYGLVQLTTSSENAIKSHVEVHAVISQYFIECMDHYEVVNLSAFLALNTADSVVKGLLQEHQQSLGVYDQLSLSAVDYLKYRLSETENIVLPYELETITMHTIYDPHIVMAALEHIKNTLMKSSPYIVNMLSSFFEEIDSLVSECKQQLNDAYKLCRKLNQSVQRNSKDYDGLTQTLIEFINTYPLCNVIQRAVDTVKTIMPYCDGELPQYMVIKCESLQIMLPECHMITISIIPRIMLYTKTNEQINSSLLRGLPSIEETYRYIITEKFLKEMDLIRTNQDIKLLEVAPNYMPKLQQLAKLHT